MSSKPTTTRWIGKPFVKDGFDIHPDRPKEMTFQMAFHKYSCYLQDVQKRSASSGPWVDEERSYKSADGHWRLISTDDNLVATVFTTGKVAVC